MVRFVCCFATVLLSAHVLATAAANEWVAETVKEGNAAYEAGDFHKALRFFDKAIEKSPRDARGRCGRGLALDAIAEYDKALLDFAEALRASPGDALAYYGQGRALRRRGRAHESMISLTKAVQLDPTGEAGFLAHCERALLFVDFGDLRQAQEDADIAIKLRPKGAEGYLARGCVHLAHGTDAECERGGLDLCRATELRPRYIDALIERAKMLASYGELMAASIDVERAIKIHGEDHKDPLLGTLHAVRAYVLLMDFIPPAALDDVKAAVELAPRESFAHYVEGDYFLRMQKYKLAIESFSRCIELGGPFQPMAYQVRGDTYADCSRYAEAIADYTQAQKLLLSNEDRASAYCNRAIVFEDLHEYTEALADYTAAIELSPKKVECYANRANVYGYLGDHEKAMADYRKAIQLDPEDAAAWVNRGAEYFKSKNFDLALVDYDKAISLLPSVPFLYERRADIYDAKGAHDRAKRDREKAKELAASSPERMFPGRTRDWQMVDGPTFQSRRAGNVDPEKKHN